MSQIIVTAGDLPAVLDLLKKEDLLVFDTETTGLRPYISSRMFSLAVATKDNEYYFNFNPLTEDAFKHTLLNKEAVKPLFEGDTKWVGQNTKFDMHMISVDGFRDLSNVSDTAVLGRIKESQHWKYSLNDLAERHLGEKKDDAVMLWLEENKAYTIESVPDKGDMVKNYHFDFVPFDIISKYAMKDARLTYDLYAYFMQETDKRSLPVVVLEDKVTPVLFHMEQVGIQTDRAYVAEASAHELGHQYATEIEFQNQAGMPLLDSAEGLSPVFEKLGYILPRTDKNNKSVADDVLETIDHPLAKLVQIYREHTKRLNTYFNSFIYYADVNGVIHTSFGQGGTNTGRMSCREPNLQNIPAEDKSPFPVRRSFVPREGYVFVSIDWDQMELRLMFDYSNEDKVIAEVNGGMDPHSATANETGLSRKAAKEINFGVAYGMGLELLAKKIGCTKEEAKTFRWKYFDKLKKVKGFLDAVKWKWEDVGTIYNWMGRRYDLDDKKWSYKGPNKIIQGGCADIVKIAMVNLHEYLNFFRSRMVLQVHDEVLFEVHVSELHIIPRLKRIMEEAYPHKHIPLTCSVSYSLKSFFDMNEVKDDFEETIREALSGQSYKRPEAPTENLVL